MNKKTKVDANTKATLKRIDALFRDLGKQLPAFPDFFMIVMMNGFGENVNLKQLYPDLYARAENEVKEMIKIAVGNPRNPKPKKTNKLSLMAQQYLKTKMREISKMKES